MSDTRTNANTEDDEREREVASEVVDAAPDSVQADLQRDLVVITKELAALAKIRDGMGELKRLYPLDVIVDVGTGKGMKNAIDGRAAYRGVKGNVEHSRKRAKAPILTMGKKLDGLAKELDAELQAGQDYYDEAIQIEERRKEADRQERLRTEALRVDALRQRVQDILDVAVRAVNLGSADIAKKIELVTRQEIGDDFLEFKGHAVNAKAETLLKLQDLKTAAEQREEREAQAKRDAEELDKLRREQAEQRERDRLAALQRERVDQFNSALNALRAGTDSCDLPTIKLRLRKFADLIEIAPDDATRSVAESVRVEMRAREQRLLEAEQQRAIAEAKSIRERELLTEIQGMQQVVALAGSAAPGLQAIEFVDRHREELALIEVTAENFGELLGQAEAMKQAATAALDALEQRRKAAVEAERREMAMQEIQGIQHQVMIAEVGRLGVRAGGTIECIRETLAETEAWTINERFGAMQGLAQMAKDAAVAKIQELLRAREQQDARAVEEAAAAEALRVSTQALDPADNANTNTEAPAAGPPGIGSRTPDGAVDGAASEPAADTSVENAPTEAAQDGGKGESGGHAEERPSEGNAADLARITPPGMAPYRTYTEGDEPYAILDLTVLEANRDPSITRVPVLSKFGEHEHPIGWLEIRTDALPPTPNFCFSLGVMATQIDMPKEDLAGTIPTVAYVGAYELKEIVPIADVDYVGFLQQIGIARRAIKIPPPRENDTRPDITVGDIQEQLGVPIAGNFIEGVLKIPSERNKGKSMWWRAGELPLICAKLVEHIEAVAARYTRDE